MEQPTEIQDVRVVHFGLGTLGSAIARAVSRRNGLTSVAAFDATPGREGRDLADLGGFDGESGVVVEASALRLGDIEADVVLYAPDPDAEGATADLELLLEVGLNVVAIVPELAYPPDEDDDDLAVSIDTLAREAEVTALALDPSDALLGTLPLTLTSVCERVDRIVVRRRGATSAAARHSLGDWTRALANSLGWAFDDFEEGVDEQPGGVGGRHQIVGRVGGRDAVLIELLPAAAGEGASLDIEIEGSPSLRLTLTGASGVEESLAMLAVNAIPAVLTSDPGLYTVSDLPPIHCWTSLGLMPADGEDLDDDI